MKNINLDEKIPPIKNDEKELNIEFFNYMFNIHEKNINELFSWCRKLEEKITQDIDPNKIIDAFYVMANNDAITGKISKILLIKIQQMIEDYKLERNKNK